MSKMTTFYKSPVRNLQHPPSPQLLLSQPNHVQSSFSGYITYHLRTWFRMSKMTPSFKSPVRNHQCPPSPQFKLSWSNHVRWLILQYFSFSHLPTLIMSQEMCYLNWINICLLAVPICFLFMLQKYFPPRVVVV